MGTNLCTFGSTGRGGRPAPYRLQEPTVLYFPYEQTDYIYPSVDQPRPLIILMRHSVFD